MNNININLTINNNYLGAINTPRSYVNPYTGMIIQPNTNGRCPDRLEPHVGRYYASCAKPHFEIRYYN